MSNQLMKYYDFLVSRRKNTIFSVNFKKTVGNTAVFSKNNFISRYEQLASYVESYNNLDCYCVINSLKTDKNRKKDNLAELKIIGFDIEFVEKQQVESTERLEKLKNLIEKFFIERYNLRNYMLVSSGNGFHLYVDIGRSIDVSPEIHSAYRSLIMWFNIDINFAITRTDDQVISITDRKEINSILRLPMTTNTKCGRTVEIVDMNACGDNTVIRKKLLQLTRRAKKTSVKKIKKINTNDALIPNTIDELENHVLVKSVFDTTLTEVNGWYETVIFAIQAIIKASGLENEVSTLEDDINALWGTTVCLSCCSSDDVLTPILGAYNFYKKHNFTKYANELLALIKSSDEEN